MALTKIIGVLCVSTFLLISALALIALPTSPAEAEAGTNLIGAEFDNLTILHIEGGALASQLVDHLEEMGGHVVRSSDIPEAVELNPEVVIIFGGEWFEQRIYDTELHDFLRLASSRGASMVMVGGTTPKFFEALDMAGLYRIPVDETGIVRNPAYFNPPLVGLKVMEAEGGYTVPSLFFSCTSSPDVLEESLIEWLPSTTPTVLASPNLQLAIEYNYSPLLDSNPHGRPNLIASIYKLKGDGVLDYDWYFYDVKVQSVPGAVVYGGFWPWWNDYTWAHHEVWNAGTYRWLFDYEPTTIYGTSTVGVSLGTGFTWSYSIKDVVVYDLSDYSENRAYWQHNIARSVPVGLMTYQSEPGFVVKTRQDYWSFVDAWYKVQFTRPFFAWWWFTRTVGPSPNLYLDAFEAGD